jgi:hypothetical protein
VAFADPLKRIIKEIYDFSDDQLWGPSQNRNAPDYRYPRPKNWLDRLLNRRTEYLSPRLALQALGGDYGRKMYSNTWVRYALRVSKIIEAGLGIYDPKNGLDLKISDPSDVVFTDLRYKNEAQAVKNAGGFLIRCVRPVDRIEVSTRHQSEVDLLSLPDSYFDAVVQNNGVLSDLEDRVHHFYDYLSSLSK